MSYGSANRTAEAIARSIEIACFGIQTTARWTTLQLLRLFAWTRGSWSRRPR